MDPAPQPLGRNLRELLITLLLGVLGALLACGWIVLQKHDPSESMGVSVTRYFMHNDLPRPVSGRKLVVFVAALPGVLAFAAVLTWQGVRRQRERKGQS